MPENPVVPTVFGHSHIHSKTACRAPAVRDTARHKAKCRGRKSRGNVCERVRWTMQRAISWCRGQNQRNEFAKADFGYHKRQSAKHPMMFSGYRKRALRVPLPCNDGLFAYCSIKIAAANTAVLGTWGGVAKRLRVLLIMFIFA